MTAILAFVLAALSAVAAARVHRRGHLPTRAVIVSERQSTIADDHGVRSVQAADFTLDAKELERLWNMTNLERLGRTYWRFLSRVTLGLIRVVYSEHERAVVLVGRPLTLLRFDAPEYVSESDHGSVHWRIKDGLLVAREGRGSGFLALDVRRRANDAADRAVLHIEVEVANFYPSIAAGFSQAVYKATQSFLHVLVTHAFLRSLASLQLYESKVGRFADPESVESVESIAEGGPVDSAELVPPDRPSDTPEQASARRQ